MRDSRDRSPRKAVTGLPGRRRLAEVEIWTNFGYGVLGSGARCREGEPETAYVFVVNLASQVKKDGKALHPDSRGKRQKSRSRSARSQRSRASRSPRSPRQPRRSRSPERRRVVAPPTRRVQARRSPSRSPSERPRKRVVR